MMETRFAPSPTGLLHLGHAASALHVWQSAREAGGQVLLRIEDIDTTRCKPHLTQAIFRDLEWLGLDWPEPVRVQSAHFEDYARCVDALAARGLAYRCFRTRAELGEGAPEGPFESGPLTMQEEAARLERGERPAWRLSLAACREALGPLWGDLFYRVEIDDRIVSVKAQPERHGDIVIARRDSPSAYHLAATHDDALQRITHVIRGEDLIDAPHIQTLLQALFDWPAPIYRHHGLVLGPDGKKLSKRSGSVSLAQLRDQGMTAQQVRAQLGF